MYTVFTIFFLCKWGISEVNRVFSLGHFQWCICKYEDGPCFDFSSGMLTVCLSCYAFEIMLQACLYLLLNCVFCVITIMNREICTAMEIMYETTM